MNSIHRIISIFFIGVLFNFVFCTQSFSQGRETPTETPTYTPTKTPTPVDTSTPTNTPLPYEISSEIQTVMGFGVVNDVLYSPDGELVAVSAENGVFIYSINNDDHTLTTHINDSGPLAFLSYYGQIIVGKTIYDMTSGEVMFRLDAHPEGISDIDVSRDESLIITCGAEKEVNLWDAKTKSLLDTYQNFDSPVHCAAFTSEGDSFVTGEEDGSVILWDIAEKQPTRTFSGSTNAVYQIDVSSNRVVAHEAITSYFYKSNFYLWNLDTGSLIQTHSAQSVMWRPDNPYEKSSISFTKDEKKFLFTQSTVQYKDKYGLYEDIDGYVTVVDAQTGSILHNIHMHDHYIQTAAFSPDGTCVITGGNDMVSPIVNVQTKEIIEQLGGHKRKFKSYTSLKQKAQYFPDGERILTTGRDNQAIVWNRRNGRIIKRFKMKNHSINCASIHPDGEMIATGGDDNLVHIWDYKSEKIMKNFFAGSSVGTCQFSSHGAWLLSAPVQGAIKLWDIEWGHVIQEYPNNLASPAVISPDMKYILARSTETYKTNLYSLQTGETYFSAYDSYIGTFSSDSRYFATRSISKVVSIWDIEKKILVSELIHRGEKYWMENVTSIHFSRDNQYLITGVKIYIYSEDSDGLDSSIKHRIYIWDWTKDNPQIVRAFDGIPYQISSLELSPNNDRLLACDDSGNAYIYDVSDLFLPAYEPDEPTYTPTQTPTVTSTLTPTSTPTLTPTLTPVAGVSQAWPEFSDGSAQGYGISNGYAEAMNPINMVLDGEGKPLVALSQYVSEPFFPSGTYLSYVLRWNGVFWEEVGTDKELGQIAVNEKILEILIDPNDQQPILSTHRYHLGSVKFQDGEWKPWKLWIREHLGENPYSDMDFLPDGTPVVVFIFNGKAYDEWPVRYSDLYEVTAIRLRKFNNGDWIEFTPGTASKSGISSVTDVGASYPQMEITGRGEIYVLWEQVHNDTTAVYLRKWNTAAWIELDGSATDFGLSGEGGKLYQHCLDLDANDQPAVVYSKEGIIHASRYDGTRWRGWADSIARSDAVSDSSRESSKPIIINATSGHPTIIWHDNSSGALYAKKFNGAAWVEAGDGAASENGIGLGDYHDAIVDNEGRAIVAYLGGEQEEIYVRRNDSNIPTVISDEPTMTPSPSPTPIHAWFVMDGYGGIHSTNPDVRPPVLPYFAPFDIARDIEPDPLSQGWYMLDGFGGIHRSSSDLPYPEGLPYFGFDIARNLEIAVKDGIRQFYLLDGYGSVHTTDISFERDELPWLGVDLCRDLEPNPMGDNWFVLDAFGWMHTNDDHLSHLPLGTPWTWAALIRGFAFTNDGRNVVIDAYGGRHTHELLPAYDVINGLPKAFYFSGFEIIWDVEIVPNN